ncbi:hypothetical protein BDK51DRAFT_30180, partial [Blyttiomyces helicus]
MEVDAPAVSAEPALQLATQQTLTVVQTFLTQLGLAFTLDPLNPPIVTSAAPLRTFYATLLALAQVYELDKSAFNGDAKGKRKTDDSPDEPPRKVAKLGPESTLLQGERAEIERRMSAFVQEKRLKIDSSNRNEFLKPRAPDSVDPSCARVDAIPLNRKVQMKLDIVHNESGPLERSLHRDEGQTGGRGEGAKNGEAAAHLSTSARLKEIEKHLNIEF